MGTKIKLTESQFKNIIEQLVNEVVPAPAANDPLQISRSIALSATYSPERKNMNSNILKIKSQGVLDQVNGFLKSDQQNKNKLTTGTRKYNIDKGLVDILNDTTIYPYTAYRALHQIMDHFSKNNINITGEPLPLNQGGKIDYTFYYPRPGTFKPGVPFDVTTGKPKSGGQSAPSGSTSGSTTTVLDKQKNLVNNGYKLPGKNGGIDGKEGYWTKRAQAIFDKQGKNGAVQFNKEIETARAKRTQKTTPPATTPKTPPSGAPVGAPSDKPGEGESLTRPAMPPQ